MVATAAAGDVCVSNCLRGSSWNRLSPGAQDALSWEPEVGTRGRTCSPAGQQRSSSTTQETAHIEQTTANEPKKHLLQPSQPAWHHKCSNTTAETAHLEEFGEGARGLPKVGIHLHQPPQPAGQLPPCSLWPEALVAQDDGPIVTTVADDSPHCLIDRSASQAGR